MIVRLLVCNGCGEEYYLDKVLLKDFVARGGTCVACGETEIQDHGLAYID